MYIRKPISQELNERYERDKAFNALGEFLLNDVDALLLSKGPEAFFDLFDSARPELAIETPVRTSDEDEQDLVLSS